MYWWYVIFHKFLPSLSINQESTSCCIYLLYTPSLVVWSLWYTVPLLNWSYQCVFSIIISLASFLLVCRLFHFRSFNIVLTLDLFLWRPVTYHAARLCTFSILSILWLPNKVCPTYCVCSVFFYCSYYIFFFFFLSSVKSLSDTFLWDALIKLMKPCRNIICHVKLFFKVLIFSKWLPLPWKWPKC